MTPSDQDSPENLRICHRCIGEPYLQGLIKKEGIPNICSYCEDEAPTISIEELANHVERAFANHFERTPTEPDGWEWAMLSDRESNYVWERSGEPAKWAILNALDVEEDVADAALSILKERHHDHSSWEVSEECEFSEEAHYREIPAGNGEYADLWNRFERIIKTESRYFSRSAQSILDEIFAGIGDLRTVNGSRLVVTAGPTRTIRSLFRARVFASEPQKLEEALKKPWLELGTPPATLAGSGRMNARGIAVFYGAQDAKTALAEVRPPVGSQVAVARFDLTRDLRLLDLNSLKSVEASGSIFDPGTIRRMERANFLEILSQLMSRAIMPHEEVSEYLPTQAVAEYLANEVGLDGMIFPSVQAGQKAPNVVLFHPASRVEEIILPRGTQIDAMLESHDSDGVQPSYYVWEKVPREQNENPEQRLRPLDFSSISRFVEASRFDDRVTSLQIDTESIQILHIDSVEFEVTSYPVVRSRIEEPTSYPFDGDLRREIDDANIADDLFG